MGALQTQYMAHCVDRLLKGLMLPLGGDGGRDIGGCLTDTVYGSLGGWVGERANAACGRGMGAET